MNERYLDESWRQSMRVKLDFNNMICLLYTSEAETVPLGMPHASIVE